ncbi:hypothetical protein Tco_0214418 [Tanacetum coccineum]
MHDLQAEKHASFTISSTNQLVHSRHTAQRSQPQYLKTSPALTILTSAMISANHRPEMSHLHHFGLIQKLPDSLLCLLHHHHHFPYHHHHCLRFLLPPLSLILSPLPVLSPSPAIATYLLGYRAAMIRLRAEALSTSHSPPPHIILSHTRADTPPFSNPPSGTPPLLPIPAPTSSPPLLLPSTNRREDRPEVTLPPQKRLGIALGPRYEVGESSSTAAARPTGGSRADYGFVATMDMEIRRDPKRYVSYGIMDT